MMAKSGVPAKLSCNQALLSPRPPRAVRIAAAVRDPATIKREDHLPGKQLKHPVRLQGTHKYTLKVKPGADPSSSFSAYMKTLGQDLSILKMPLGASITKIHGNDYQVVAPCIQLFEKTWLQPTAPTEAESGDGFIGLESKQCNIKGSDNLPNLNDAFNLLVSIRFMYQDGLEPLVTSMVTLAVDLDMPLPFSLTPKPILEGAGSVAFDTTLKIMLDGYMRNLREDYERWRTDPQLRAARAEKAAAAAAAAPT
ncbi:hypothetical protein DUNSADRAFT_3684 [Dunaliella salina]|uniref:Uncharacterized protein n=1 Tax=Dunaliella salina TaxID=3046 RepID=A0ABQ7GTK2_DUNSA|nr:hypothetical protein DUNSADRAFT_3684 [Dunaliella salina]|eukprot:KAF5837907.1 hypothetical protein DUNSADRAFT_3684 [Dunaliella salina]